MSVPHLDTRMIDGTPALLFGPYAGFSTRFLKNGSLMDLPRSIRASNISAMLAVARDNWPLTKYLIEQVMQSHNDRIKRCGTLFPMRRPRIGNWLWLASACRLSRKTPKKAVFCNLVRKLFPARMDQSLHFWGFSGCINCSPNYADGSEKVLCQQAA